MILAVLVTRAAGQPAPTPVPAASAAEPTPSASIAPEPPGPEWTLRQPIRRFVGRDLFNHIDGAAERFLEMGFDEVAVRRFEDGKATLIHEVYAMSNATAARGIYFYLRGRGSPVAGIDGRHVGNRYQVTAQKDRYLVVVSNGSGDERCLPAMAALVRQSLAAVPRDGDVPLTDLLPAEGLVAGSETIVCGPYALESVFSLGDGDILQLQGQRCGIAADYRNEAEESFTLLVVPYGGAEAAMTAFTQLQQSLDPHLRVLRRGEHDLVFQDQRQHFGKIEVRGDRLELRLHLVRDPGPG